MKSDEAIKCFDENRRLFGDPHCNPEEFNLYNGLASLAEAVKEIQIQIRQLHQEMDQIRSDIRNI